MKGVEGAVIYITNVRVRRTWTPPSSPPRLISLSDQMGVGGGGCIIYQMASKWRKDIHHCPPFKLDPTDAAISQTHQCWAAAEGSPAETFPSVAASQTAHNLCCQLPHIEFYSNLLS